MLTKPRARLPLVVRRVGLLDGWPRDRIHLSIRDRQAEKIHSRQTRRDPGSDRRAPQAACHYHYWLGRRDQRAAGSVAKAARPRGEAIEIKADACRIPSRQLYQLHQAMARRGHESSHLVSPPESRETGPSTA